MRGGLCLMSYLRRLLLIVLLGLLLVQDDLRMVLEFLFFLQNSHKNHRPIFDILLFLLLHLALSLCREHLMCLMLYEVFLFRHQILLYIFGRYSACDQKCLLHFLWCLRLLVLNLFFLIMFVGLPFNYLREKCLKE